MHRHIALRRFASVAMLLSLGAAAARAERVEEPGNAYMTGADARLTAPVHGDLIAAAGRISVDFPVAGDAVLAAGSIDVRSRIGDDLRAAGGIITIAGSIGGEAVIAGGSIAFSPTAEIRGRTWLAGNDVAVAGRLHGALKVYARNILVLGQIAGNAHLAGESIEILPAAHISGRVSYVSGKEIKIHPGAAISGTVTREPGTFLPFESRLSLPGWPPFRPLLMSGLLAAGALLLALFPRFTASALYTVGAAPVKSLGLGTAIFFSAPPVIVLLVITIIGIPIALVLAGIYAAALLAGFLIAALFIGDRLARLARKPAAGYWGRVLSLAVALLLLWLVRYVPYVGIFLIVLALIVGLGAMVMQAFSNYAERR